MPFGKYKPFYRVIAEQKAKELKQKQAETLFKKKAEKDLKEKGSTEIGEYGTLFYDKETKEHSIELEQGIQVMLIKKAEPGETEKHGFWIDVEKGVTMTLRRKP